MPLFNDQWIDLGSLDGEGTTTDDQIIANNFNKFFTDKINNIKEEIDPSIIQDPLIQLREKMSKKGKLSFEIKTITETEVV